MKKSIVYSSISGNTKMIAEVIEKNLEDVIYVGKPTEEALDADVIYVGSWTVASSCAPEIKEILSTIKNKKIFLFMTAGYGSSEEFFNKILSAAKENIDESNEVIGEFICQGKVSEVKQEAIKKMDIEKYEGMKHELEKGESHPNKLDLEILVNKLKDC